MQFDIFLVFLQQQSQKQTLYFNFYVAICSKPASHNSKVHGEDFVQKYSLLFEQFKN